MHKRMIIMFVVALGVLLSTTASAQAQSIPQPTFDIIPSPGYVNEPVTATDNSGGGGLHEWDCHYTTRPEEFDPEQTGNSATCVYSDADFQTIAQRITIGTESRVYWDQARILPQADKPFDTILASPNTVSLPNVVLFQSNKSTLEVQCHTGTQNQVCPAEVVSQTAPDGSGIRTFSVQIDNAAVGEGIVLETQAYNDFDSPQDFDSFNLYVSSNANAPYKLVDRTFLTCVPDAKRRHSYQVGAQAEYYQSGGADPTRVMVKLQRKSGKPSPNGKHRWLKVKKVVGEPDGSESSPYLLKQLSVSAKVSQRSLKKQKYRVKTKFYFGSYEPSQTKVSRLTLSKCG